MARRIPIRNLYYLLCYAWDVLEERDDTLAAELDGLSHVELLAKVLAVSVRRLWKRGLDRGYRTLSDDLRSPRGRLDLQRTIARQLEPVGLAACRYDELEPDILHNQIIATTIRRLGRLTSLASDIREGTVAVDRMLSGVSTIPLTSSTFSQLQLHGRLRRYGLPLHVCKLIFDQLAIDESTGEVRFRDYVEDDKRMARLFEKFIYNFCSRELRGWTVKRDTIEWDLEPLTPGAGGYLPKMQTDISLRGFGRTVIIDTKFYADAFISRFEGGGEKIRPAHLYQLTAYLRNLSARNVRDAEAVGVLLYPEVQALPTLKYRHGKHHVTATGIDLTQDWRVIHQRILDLVAAA